MLNKKLVFALVGLAFFLTLMGLADAEVYLISPANGTNHTTSALFNVTFLNLTDIQIIDEGITGMNATFYRESGTTRTLLGNSSSCAGNGSLYYCWGTLTLTTAIDGIYNISVQITNSSNTGWVNTSANGTDIYFDTSVPQCLLANISSPSSGTNHSESGGLLILNVSTIDLTLGLQAIFFNITNSSGVQNATYTATNPGSHFWNATLNTSHFPDGYYNVTVHVNDTVNNINNTAATLSMIFDNTPPVVTHSCDYSTIDEGDTLTCSCSGTSTSGVSSTSYTENPSTSSTGTFSVTCTATSYGGLTNTGSTTYTVISPAGDSTSGPSSSPSTQTWTVTHTATEEQFEDGFDKEVKENERISVPVSTGSGGGGGSETHHVGVLEITSTTVKVQVSSDPQEAILSVGESEKFEVTDDNYYDLLVALNSISGSNADITVMSIYEEMPQSPDDASGDDDTGGDDESTGGDEGTGEGGNVGTWIIVIIILVIIVAVVWFVVKKKK